VHLNSTKTSILHNLTFFKDLDQLNINELADIDSNDDDEELLLPEDSTSALIKRREQQRGTISRSPLNDKNDADNSDDDF
jgi:hypothetical protein